MIAAWMLYSSLVAGLLYGAALVAERAPAALGGSRRWVWAVTIAASVGLPLLVALRRGPLAAAGRVLPAEAAGAMRRTLEPIVASGGEAPGGLAALDALLVGGWIASSLVLLVLLVVGHRALGRARGSWTEAGRDELGVDHDGLRALAAGAPVRITDAQGPAVAGALRTEILLPRWCLDLPAAERALVLAHEGEHVRAGDPRLLLGARLVAIAFPWLLPLWWQLRRLQLAVEIDCDARVLRRGFAPPSYGRLLLQVGSRRSTERDHSRAIAALAAPSSQLERRIRAMFDSTPRARWVRATGAVALAAGLVVVACESPTPFEAEAETEVPVAAAEYTEVPLAKIMLRDHNQKWDASLKRIEGSQLRLDGSENEFTLHEVKPDESGEPVELKALQRKAELASQYRTIDDQAAGGVLRKMAPADGEKSEFHFREQP